MVYSYLVELRNIAINFRLFSPVTMARLKKADILIASKHIQTQKSDKVADHNGGDEEGPNMEYELLSPDQVVVVDDMITYQQFREAIFCAPQETILEGGYCIAYLQNSILTLETTGFYQSLGCKQLSDVVQEELQETGKATNSNIAHNIQSLILERLPFFLEHNHAATKITTWLKDKENFTIRTFRKFTVKRSLNFAGVKVSKSLEPSAAARRRGKGGIELWLTDGVEVDMYEVAASLCHLLFSTKKANDTLLLMTILSADLRTLQKRGYPGNYEPCSFFTLLIRFWQLITSFNRELSWRPLL